MKTFLTTLIQNAAVSLGTFLVTHHVSQSESSALTAMMEAPAVIGFLIALFGAPWHFLEKTQLAADAEAWLARSQRVLMLGIVVFSVLAMTGCSSPGGDHVRFGVLGNGIGLSVSTPVATNSYRLVLPLNMTNLVNGFISAEGF